MNTFVDNLLYHALGRTLCRWMERYKREQQKVFMWVMPGGKLPVRSTDGAIGYDYYVRAVVSADEMDPLDPRFRKPLFDFKTRPSDPAVARHVHEVDGKLVYRMDPHESITVGIGFVTAMPFPMFYWVAPRSGLSSRKGITLTNAPGTVDPDYRGEAGALVFNRNNHHFDIGHHMRIPQGIYQEALIPEIVEVEKYEDLPTTLRGSGGFGSTGLYEIAGKRG